MSTAWKESIVVGDWTVDANARCLRRGDESHPLEPQAYKVLRHLCDHPGELVSTDELLDTQWAGVVVTPNSLTRVIAKLRKAFGDSAREPRYIETVTRTGYRLIADVAPLSPLSNQRWRPLAVVVALAVLLAISLMQLMPQRQALTLAVFPPENATGNSAMDYIAAGLAEELIAELAAIPELAVPRRHLTFGEEAANAESRALRASELGVSYYLEGSMSKTGENLRLSVQLVDTQSGYILWSGQTQETVPALLSRQQSLTRQLIGEIGPAIGLATAHAPRRQTHQPVPEAYELYLKGRWVWHQRGKIDMEPAVQAFAEAVRIDPDFARAWAALASAYVTWPTYSEKGQASRSQARYAAEKALQLDPTLGEPHLVLASFAEGELDWVTARERVLRGLKLEPESFTVQFWAAEHFRDVGDFNRSMHHYLKAREIDPTVGIALFSIGMQEFMVGNRQTGRDILARLAQDGMSLPLTIANYYDSIDTGNYALAREIHPKSPPAASPEHREVHLRFLQALESGQTPPGLTDDIRNLPTGFQFDHRDQILMLSRLGEYDALLDYLIDRTEAGDWTFTAAVWEVGEPVLTHPMFEEFLQSLGLIELWTTHGWGELCQPAGASIECSLSSVKPVALDTLLTTPSE